MSGEVAEGSSSRAVSTSGRGRLASICGLFWVTCNTEGTTRAAGAASVAATADAGGADTGGADIGTVEGPKADGGATLGLLGSREGSDTGEVGFAPSVETATDCAPGERPSPTTAARDAAASGLERGGAARGALAGVARLGCDGPFGRAAGGIGVSTAGRTVAGSSPLGGGSEGRGPGMVTSVSSGARLMT